MNPTPLNSDMYVIKPLEDDRVQSPLPPTNPYAKTAFLRMLWNHRPLLFRWAAWGLLAAILIAFLIPKEYEATTRLMPPDDQSGTSLAIMAALGGRIGGGGGGGGGLGAIAGDLLGMKSSGALFTGMLKSRTVQDHIINKFDLRKVYWRKSWDVTRQRLADNTLISEDRKSGILAIKVTDGSPQRAAAMAQEYVSELNIVVSQLSTSSARRERIFLEERLNQVKQDLEVAEKDFGQYASKTGAVDIKEQAKATMGAAATLQGELIATQSELEGLRQIYTDNNVRVRSVRARVAELQGELNKIGGKDEAASDTDDSQDQSPYPSLRKLPLLGVSYADLFRRAKVQEAVYETLTQQYELAKVAEAKEIPSVKVLDPAEVPEKKSFPPRLLIIFFGTFFSLALGASWVIAKQRWNQVDLHDPRKDLASEVFHTVNSHMPWATPNGSRFQAASHQLWIKLAGKSRNGVQD
jgi:capsule polysaccharide export protein KpsE/RkpR